MSNAVLTMSGWGLFFCVLLFYIRWVVAERAFFVGSDPEHWNPESQDGVADSAVEARRPPLQLSSAAQLGRPA